MVVALAIVLVVLVALELEVVQEILQVLLVH